MTLCTVLAQVKPFVVHVHSAVHQVYPAVSSGLYVAIVATHVYRYKIVNVVFNNACHYYSPMSRA